MEPQEYAKMFSLEEDYWWYRALRRRILTALPRPSASERPRCLDAGCGSGMTLADLADTSLNGARVLPFGMDLNATALSFAKRRGLSRLVRASVEALPFADASLDFVISADVLYHRAVGDDVAALREMARCLKPGGVVVLNLPAFAWITSAHDRAIHTARRYTAREVRAKLCQAGLEPLRVRYWNCLLFLPIVVVRLLRRWESARAQPVAESPGGPSADPPESDLVPIPSWLNRMLDGLMILEERLSFLPAPMGLSIMAVARKG